MASFGIVGLGRIGGGLGLQALKKGHRVVGFDIAGHSEELSDAGLVGSTSLRDLASKLASPRVIFLYVHAGELVDAVCAELEPALEPGDVIVDGGNSYWGDSIQRHKRWIEKGIHFIDLGTSGGLSGARKGACFMLGGTDQAKALVAPILHDLCVPGGFVDAGGPGSGHYVKLVHNGIEFGMLQAIGEGIDLLENFPQPIDIESVLGCWRNGSVVRSWLIDLMHEAYQQDPKIDGVPGYIEDTGEVNWLVADALEMEVPIPVISQSVMQLFASRDERKSWARAVAMMRHGFGGHPYGPLPSLQNERKTSRVGGIQRPPKPLS